jgi:XTP/dITP diphosphohydrolase
MASARHFTGDKLAIASHNAGKVREIGDLIRPLGVSVVSASELDLAEPVEDGTTFQANAIIKAKTATTASGLPALADDSGLAITALGGAPGIYSARWAGADKDFNAAMAKVEQELGGATDRSAAFIVGVLVWPPRGARGFGYDPVFQAEGRDITFGEMDPVEKHSISHRAKAFAGLVAACFGSS